MSGTIPTLVAILSLNACMYLGISACARMIPGGAGGAGGGGGGGGMEDACVVKLMLSAMAATTLSARFFSSATSSHPLCAWEGSIKSKQKCQAKIDLSVVNRVKYTRRRMRTYFRGSNRLMTVHLWPFQALLQFDLW